MNHIAPTDVRMAVPEDRDVILQLIAKLHEENGLLTISIPKITAAVDRYFSRDRVVIAVIGPVGAPVAGIFLEISTLIYSDDHLLVEQFNFVHPDHRRTTFARQLISYAKQVSDQLHLPLMIGILSNTRTEAKVRLYEQMLDKAGAYFIYGMDYLTAPGWKRAG